MNTMRPGVYDAKELVNNLQSTFEMEIEALKQKNDDFNAYYYSSRALDKFGYDKAELLKSIVDFYVEMNHLSTSTPRIVDEFKQILNDLDVALKTVNNADRRFLVIDKLLKDLSFVKVAWKYKNYCQEASAKLKEINLADYFPETMTLLSEGSVIELN